MILVVDMSWARASLAFKEFVLPIVSVLQSFEECVVKHFLDIDSQELNNYSRIVLSGNALKDNAVIKHVEKFSWIKEFGKPILGICAGMQIISLVFDAPLVVCLNIGMVEITTLQETPLFRGSFKAYALHNYSVGQCNNFEVLAKSEKCIQAIRHKQKSIYGLLFHPEVRNQEILERFVETR